MSGTQLPIVDGRRTAFTEEREIRSPWDRRLVGVVGLAGPAEIEAAIVSSLTAAPALSKAPAFERAEWLEKVADGLRSREDVFVETIISEAGKPKSLARAEVGRAIDTFRISAAEARRIGGEVIPLDALPSGAGRLGITRRFPAGPVVAVTPFNFPLNLVAHKVGPALAAGCPVILKPADQTPLCALLLGEIAVEAGAPPGSLNVVPCKIEQVATLVEDERVAVLSFTGSAKVGWSLKSRAGKKRVLLELGGNAAAVVHDDADLAHAAARCASGAFAYAGQVCISLQRIVVHESVRDELLTRLLEETGKLQVGDPSDSAVLVGPLRSDADADRVMGWIEEARAAGAKLLCGGRRDGRIIAPTVLSGVGRDHSLWREEVFGPVVVVETYSDESEALSIVNDSEHGLQAGVFTNDLRFLMSAYETLKVGAVIHDDVPSFRVDHMPYGGVKSSGLGREGVRWAIEEMTELRLLALKK